MKRIAILGSTGSIGRSTLSIVESFPDKFQVLTLAAGSNLELALEQARRWHPKVLSVANEKDADVLRTQLRQAGLAAIEVVHGSKGTIAVATHPEVDFVVSAIVGVAGLEATYEAVKAGKAIGLANKECLVAAGELITAEARRQAKPLLPIDSEHNAIHQCMRGGRLPEGARGENLVIAYEPVWAIGTGLTPTLRDVAEMHSFIRLQLAARYGEAGEGVRVLYGGSVKPANARELLAAENVDENSNREQLQWYYRQTRAT